MAVTWKIAQIDRASSLTIEDVTLSDVCTAIHWNASDSETVGSAIHKGYSYGELPLANPDSSDFTAYADITESKAIAWTKAKLGATKVTEIEDKIADEIAASKNPTNPVGIPWS